MILVILGRCFCDDGKASCDSAGIGSDSCDSMPDSNDSGDLGFDFCDLG